MYVSAEGTAVSWKLLISFAIGERDGLNAQVTGVSEVLFGGTPLLKRRKGVRSTGHSGSRKAFQGLQGPSRGLPGAQRSGIGRLKKRSSQRMYKHV